MELIPMTDKVFDYKYDENEPLEYQDIERLESIINYANFLKMKLELGMFIPCDEKGNVLEKPKEDGIYTDGFSNPTDYNYQLEKYQEAKDRVIFEGLHICIDKDGYNIDDKDGTLFFVDNKNTMGWVIEDLIEFFNLTITKKAIDNYKLK